MKILFLSQIVPYPPHGGVLQRGYNVLRELGRHAEVHLLAFVHADLLPGEAEREQSRRALGAFCKSVEFFPLWVKKSRWHLRQALGMSALSSLPYSAIAHRSAAYMHRVAEIRNAVPFDVVHVDTIALHQFVGPGPAVPTALTHHNIESSLMGRRAQVESGQLARRFLQRESDKLKAYESAVAPLYDVNIVMSTADQRLLESHVPGVRTAVVPNGVDVDYFRPDPDRQTPALVYAGGMNMFANRDAVMFFLKDIWPQIVAEAPETRFFAIGQDPPPELLALAARDPRIVVTGYVADVRPHILDASVYVVPLRVGGGTRLKVLDALAMGKAIVSTSIGCEGIEVEPGRHLAIADEPREFARATLALLGDRAARLSLGRAARELAEKRYAWPAIGHRLFEAYRLASERRVA